MIGPIVNSITSSIVTSIIQSATAIFSWVPNFNGTNSYAQFLTAFSPTGSGTTLSLKGVYKNNSATQQLLAPDSSSFSLTVNASNVISFGLLTSVTINGASASSGSTVLAEGYFEILATVTSTADIDVIAANASFGDNFQTQLHYLYLNDTDDTSNDLLIDTVIISKTMPVVTDIFNSKDGSKAGDLINLGSVQPYVPQIKGGAQDRSFEVLKSEQYNGDFTGGNWNLGVELVAAKLTRLQSAGGSVGSWSTGDIATNDILVGKNGAVLKITGTPIANQVVYAGGVLLGNDAMIQAGFEHPNVIRLLKPDATAGSEYKHFNDGGLYPWPG
jgi:hypothetical protein